MKRLTFLIALLVLSGAGVLAGAIGRPFLAPSIADLMSNSSFRDSGGASALVGDIVMLPQPSAWLLATLAAIGLEGLSGSLCSAMRISLVTRWDPRLGSPAVHLSTNRITSSSWRRSPMVPAWSLRTALSFVAIWLTIASSSLATTILSSAVNPANGHTYYLVGDDPQGGKGISWTEAEAFAMGLGGHLTTIRSADENMWVQQTFPQYPFLWIGLSDHGTEGAYEWADGEPANYLNWYPGEPNNYGGNEDFVELYNFWGGGWNDNGNISFDSSGWGFAAVAEVPEPSTLSLGVIALMILVIVRASAGPFLPCARRRPVALRLGGI